MDNVILVPGTQGLNLCVEKDIIHGEFWMVRLQEDNDCILLALSNDKQEAIANAKKQLDKIKQLLDIIEYVIE